MGERKTIAKKLVIIFIVFVLLFSSSANTLFAIATSDEFEVISNGFFQKEEIKYKAYFTDENDKEIGEKIANVNEKAKVVLEINPQVEGYLKEGSLKAVSDDGKDLNFKIIGVKSLNKDVQTDVAAEKDTNTVNLENITNTNSVISNSQDENIVNSENVDNNTVSNTAVENEVVNSNDLNTLSNTVINNVLDNNVLDNNVASNNTVSNTIANTSADNTSINEFDSKVSQDLSSVTTTINDEKIAADDVNLNSSEVFVDEDKVIEDKIHEKEDSENNIISNYTDDVKVVADNEISISNIIDDTKLELEIEFVSGDELSVDSLRQDVKFQLSGTFINENLEEVKIAKEQLLSIGWKYTKDIELTSEYTKFSPFVVSDVTGTIVENKISVKREITDKNYLPLKSNRIEITVPEVNGKKPIAVDVSASKLLATNGEDVGKVNFSQDNWTYNQESGIITINVNNETDGKAKYSFGTDEYVVIYRYEDYVDENSNLSNKVKAQVEEYSAKENNVITKEINKEEEILVDIGELITYSIGTNNDKINRAFVNANYNSDISYYEAQYTNNISLNILTSDLLEELKVDITKDVYKDIAGTEFNAEGIAYKSIKFNYSDLKSLLIDGGEIIITNKNNEVIGTLNKDLLVSEESATINLNDTNGIYVYVKNVSHDGVLSFEVTKAIKKCNYEKAAFNNFKTINSRISAEVKYYELEDLFRLKEIECKNEFENSVTTANIIMEQDSLSSMYQNDNVDFKIELNNDKLNSDLYINPIFEIVFPKNVKEVNINSINLIYEDGLIIKDYKITTESDIVKLKIELEGTQTNFIDSSYTNGTNVLLSLDIKLDEYTSAKQDQIKLYYYNEGATNYSSQTKWSIDKVVPKGILKETNGFDAVVFDYKTPSGLVAVNTIRNYDGNLGEVKSVKQGEKIAQVEVGGTSRIATMELLALNNTGNVCTDVTLLGRIPFAGNKDVISGEDLKTNVSTTITGLINTDATNGNITEVYYSTNGEASKDLDNIGNGWTKEPGDITQVKSYLIVVKGTMQSGNILRFTYDFNIPENLPYESKILGSFGAFYNNNSDIAVVYESNVADKVGLQTESGPKLESTLSVDIGDNSDVLAGKILKYTAKVKNTGSVEAIGVEVKFTKPEYASFVKKDLPQYGDYGYLFNEDAEEKMTIDSLKPGEEKEVSCFVRTNRKPLLEEYATGKDDNGYYIEKVVGYKDVEINVDDGEHEEDAEGTTTTTQEPIIEKEYIVEVPDIYVQMKASVSSSILANSIETNEIKNKLVKANFDSKIRVDFDREVKEGMETNFSLILTNTSGNDLENVNVSFKLGEIYSYQSALLDGNADNVSYDETNKVITYNIGNMSKNKIVNLSNKLVANQLNMQSKVEDYYFEISSNDIKEESIKIPQTFMRAFLNAKDVTDAVSKTINENETITISSQITNVGLIPSTEGILEINVPDSLEIEKIVDENGVYLSSYNEDGVTKINLPGLAKDESVIVDVIYKSKNLAGNSDSEVVISRKVTNGSQTPIILLDCSIKVVNNIKTDEEIEEESNKKLQESIDEANKNQNENQNSNSNSQNNQTEQNNDELNNSNNNQSNASNESNDEVKNENNNENTSTENNNEIKNENNTNENNNNEENSVDTLIYSISGEVWNDSNKDGRKDSDEAKIAGVTVQLLKDGNMEKVTSSDSKGYYSFRNLEKGNYEVVFEYDSDKYTTTVYKAKDVAADIDSDAVEAESGKAVTNSLSIVSSNLENIDLGLKDKDTLDLSIEKYLTNSKVITSKATKEVKYDNSKISKLEIRAKELEGAIVKLEYNIVVENKGLTNGYANKILDQIPDGMEFDEKENTGWYLGTDGILYNETLKDVEIKPGDKKELKLVLSKKMNSDNTGIVSNKIVLEDVSTTRTDLQDDVSNNISTQEVLITVSTGGNISMIIAFIIIILLAVDIYIHRDKIKIISDYKYKNSVNKKIKTKKIYK